MASDLSFFFCFTLLPEENGSRISSGSADDTVDGEVVLVLGGTGEPEPSTIGVLAIGEIIIGGLVVCSLPKTLLTAENTVSEIGS
jgi:hypothetical protein